jgi:copper chaperone
METLKFKTNINCSGCVANVTPALNKKLGEQSWKVNTHDSRKILTVETKNLDAEEIIEAVREAGYKAEPVS